MSVRYYVVAFYSQVWKVFVCLRKESHLPG